MDRPSPFQDLAAPLSDRMRPTTVDEFFGQEHLLSKGKLLHRMISGDTLHSIILWGPPGSGKTTLARIIADTSRSIFISLSAVTSGIKDVRQVIQQAAQDKDSQGRQPILFIDEIHRFNKAQQDAFLPHVETGGIILIGATTENPSFEVVSPLLSRTKVLVLKPLDGDHIRSIIQSALTDSERGLGSFNIRIVDEALDQIVGYCQGDARVALNCLELAAMLSEPDANGVRNISVADMEEALQKKMLIYDKSGDEHYNLISALHKSLRGSDAHASIYWLARMLEAGEDPLYIARRLIRFASEDVGNADPRALQVCLNAKDAYHFVGLPEGKLALAQAVLYLATAPKSNAVYTAFQKAESAARESGSLPVPLHIRNAPTALMKNLDYGKGYLYAHDDPDAIVDQSYLPESIQNRRFYFPPARGFEKTIKERMDYIEMMRNKKKKATKS